jgi:hypothetical protein
MNGDLKKIQMNNNGSINNLENKKIAEENKKLMD